jgi:NAD(P)-dependent dehydrogenase (short-subunit alcohol dehydrogenase family)
MKGEKVMKRFDNRTVIVTGGARGMGASHAHGFVAEGANVVRDRQYLLRWRDDGLPQQCRVCCQQVGSAGTD